MRGQQQLGYASVGVEVEPSPKRERKRFEVATEFFFVCHTAHALTLDPVGIANGWGVAIGERAFIHLNNLNSFTWCKVMGQGIVTV